MSTIARLWVRSSSGTPPESRERIELVENQGVTGDHVQGGRRQITLIDRDSWAAACAEVKADLDPAFRRANVLVEGIDLAATIGSTLQLGEVRIEVLGETTPCALMDEMHDGLCKALAPERRGGVFGQILDSGSVSVGDAVHVIGS